MADLLPLDLLDRSQHPWRDAADLEATDPRLEAVATLVSDGAYVEAGQAAAEVLREAPDVRVIGAYLFAAFLERGLAALPQLMQSTLGLLTSEWELLRPKAKREIAAAVSLRWLFRTLVKHLEHHEREQDDVWKALCDEGNAPKVAAALQLIEPVAAAMADRIAAHGTLEAYRHFAAWLAKHGQFLASAPARPSTASPAGGADAKAGEASAAAGTEAPRDALAELRATSDGRPAAATEGLNGVDGASVHPAGGAVPRETAPAAAGIPISPALATLLQKLRSFEILARRGDFQKAGIVAADVLAIVDHFDPRLYLPSVFGGFFAALSAHAAALEPIVDGQSSLELRALQHLYHSNLEAFVEHTPRQGSGGAGFDGG